MITLRSRVVRATALVLACTVLASAPASAGPCGDLGKRGDLHGQLAVLGCLTGVAVARPSAAKSLRAEIDRGFREAYEDLCKRPFLDEEIGAWVELYRMFARFYPRREELAPGLPIAFVNSHHFSLPHWIERSLKTPLGTLVHFDTHSDMEGTPRVDDAKRAVLDLRAGKNTEKAWHLLAHVAYRNSMPVTGAVLAAGVNEVIWAKPAWSTDPVDFTSRAFFYARPKGFGDPRPLEDLEKVGPDAYTAAFRGQLSDFFMLHYDPADNRDAWLPRREREIETWSVVDHRQRPHADNFEHVADIRFSIMTTDRADFDPSALARAVSGDKFVLDIDLDYFVNQGAPPEQETTDDFSSFGQRAIQRRDEPDSSLAIFNAKRFRAAAVSAERAIIERRIRRFLKTLKALKAAGKTPSIVSIADSANLPFSTRGAGQEQAEFMPPHHAYWVHERVVAAIREVYGDGAASNLGDGPTEAAALASKKSAHEPIVPASHVAHKQVRETLRDALYGALAWAAGASTTYSKTPHLSAYLLIVHTIAQHGPDVGLREAARAVGRVLSRLMDATVLGPSMSASRAGAEEALRRIAFSRRYGNTEWETALAGARWYAKQVGLTREPDIDAETTPLQPSKALTDLGLRRTFAGGSEANLVDVFLGSQATDGGFTIAEMPTLTRAVYSLSAVRAIVAMLSAAEVPAPPSKPLWAGLPYTRAHLDDAIARGVAFTLAYLGELPSTEPAIDALLVLKTATQLRGVPAASQFARIAGKLLAGRIASKLPTLLSGLTDPDQISAFAELGDAMAHFGVDVTLARSILRQRAGAFPPDRILGINNPQRMSHGDATRLVSRAAALTRFGIPGFDYGEALRTVLPMTGVATFTDESQEIVDRFTAVTQAVLTATSYGKTRLERPTMIGEWRFLEQSYVEVLASRRMDMVASMLEARRALGDTPDAPRQRDLYWQLLHEQNADGSWGRKVPEDARLRSTWAALSALGDHEEGREDVLTRTAASILRGRPDPGPVAAPTKPVPGFPKLPGRPGGILGRRGGIILPSRAIPAIRGR